MTGAVPGLGKSTLARGLAAALDVTLFEESDIRTDPAFVEVMDTFETTGTVPLDVMLDAGAAFEPAPGRQVLDALFPYLQSLLAWEPDDDAITAFFGDLADRLAPHRMVELHLTNDAEAALARAVAREDDGWLEWLAANKGVEPGALVDHLAAAADRAVRLLSTAPWPVHVIDVTDVDASHVLAEAQGIMHRCAS